MSLVINLEKDSYSWTGKLICPTVEVILDDVVLTEETDYTVSYENNKNIGTGIVKVNAIDNSWSEETTFTITPVSMNDIEVRYEYEDEEFQVVSLPKVHLWLNDYRLLYGIDYAYDVVNRETKFALYSNTTFRSLTANIVDTITMEFKVKKIWVNIGNESFHFDKNEFIYNRSVQKPTVTTTGDVVLGRDYEIVCPDSKDFGKYVLTINGIGEYKGTIQYPYEIKKRSIVDCNLDFGPSDENGAYDVTKFKVYVDDMLTTKKIDYVLWYFATVNEDKSITAEGYVEGIYNYEGRYDFTVSIGEKTIFTRRIVELDDVTIYIRAYGWESIETRSGTFYLWDDEVHNNRIRITRNIDYCGMAGSITGWVDVSELDRIKEKYEVEESVFLAGECVRLYKVNAYKHYYDIKPTLCITGKYYISKNALYNHRVRVCHYPEQVGIEKKVAGWVDMNDIYVDNIDEFNQKIEYDDFSHIYNPRDNK